MSRIKLVDVTLESKEQKHLIELTLNAKFYEIIGQ